jgi:hypothetical protein
MLLFEGRINTGNHALTRIEIQTSAVVLGAIKIDVNDGSLGRSKRRSRQSCSIE